MGSKFSDSSTDNSNMQALIVLALIGAAAASGQYQYHGRYAGKCGNDGIYFRDSGSFVMCSNGNSYVQPCAPGSRNAAYGSYSYGQSYGYGHAAPAYGAPAYGYGRDAYRPDQYRNQNGYATRAAYNDGYGYGAPAYGGPAYGGYGYDAPRYGGEHKVEVRKEVRSYSNDNRH